MKIENPLLRYDGLSLPSSDFQAVRDGRRSPIAKYEIDLSSARSIGAGTALFLGITGNAFFIDQNTDVGNATVIFQEDDNVQPAAVYVQSGFIASVPFTRIIVQNSAQAGKVLRIFYGVDIDFRPGMSATVSGGVTITGPLRDTNVAMAESGATPGAYYKSNTALAANTAETVFAPASNVNGAIVWRAQITGHNGVQYARAAILAKSAAPASIIDGDLLLLTGYSAIAAGFYPYTGAMFDPVRVAAGKGLYAIVDQAEIAGHRHVSYTLL